MMRGLVLCGLKTIAVALLLASVGFCQNEQKTLGEQKPPTPVVESSDTYKLDFVIRESQDGKVIATHNYSALVEHAWSRPRTIRIGSRLPVGGATGNQTVNYLDVGTNLNYRVWTLGGHLILSLTVEVSSVANPESTSGVKLADYPIVRQFRTDQEAAIPLSKPTLLDSVDDPNSNHKFQIEVTATKEN
jgi:hypothetical protein